MKNLLTGIILLFGFFANSQVDTVQIRALVTDTDATKWDSVSVIDVFESTEGGSISYYFLGGKVLKIQISDYWESAQTQTRYYIKDTSVIYFSHFEYLYNAPMYIDLEGIIKMRLEEDSALNPLTIDTNQVVADSGYEPWDFDKSKVNGSECFFKDGELQLQIIKHEFGEPEESYLDDLGDSFINQYFDELLLKLKDYNETEVFKE